MKKNAIWGKKLQYLCLVKLMLKNLLRKDIFTLSKTDLTSEVMILKLENIRAVILKRMQNDYERFIPQIKR